MKAEGVDGMFRLSKKNLAFLKRLAGGFFFPIFLKTQYCRNTGEIQDCVESREDSPLLVLAQ